MPPAHSRIYSLDVLRGVATLGILSMNIQSFAMVEAAYSNPSVHEWFTGSNVLVWTASRLFADMKFMTIFSLMFGVSMLLIAEGAERRGQSATRLHLRRNLALLLIGAAHGHLLWHGDILAPYAICALVVFWFRRWPPRRQFLAGLTLLAVGSLILLAIGLSTQGWDQASIEDFEHDLAPTPEMMAEETDIFRGSWAHQMPRRSALAFMVEAIYTPLFVLWRSGGLMLIGMAFLRWGIVSAERSRRFYLAWLGLALTVGLGLVAWGIRAGWSTNWDPIQFTFFNFQYNYWGSLLVAMGWISAVMLLTQSALAPRLGPFAAVGKMALSNYLGQTVLCTLLFYGHGLGQFERMDRLEQSGVVLLVWVIQLLVSSWWMSRFQYGPAERAWRAATVGSWPPLRRSTP